MPFNCIEPEILYARDSKLKRQDVQILREWLKKQPHLPELKETQIILFLHSCFYKIEPTKVTIDKYFTRRTHHLEFFSGSEDIVRKTYSVGFFTILPKRTPDGSIIYLGKLLDPNLDTYNFVNQTITAFMMFTLYLHQHGFGNGLISIFDLKGGNLGHLTRVNFAAMKHGVDHVQEGLPVRIKGIHFINTVPFMDKILGILKSIISSEIYNKIQCHSSLDTLCKSVSKELLPEDYGGYLPPIQVLRDECLTNILENFDFLKWHDSQKVDETKRTELISNGNSGFGIEGTFKKLEID